MIAPKNAYDFERELEVLREEFRANPNAGYRIAKDCLGLMQGIIEMGGDFVSDGYIGRLEDVYGEVTKDERVSSWMDFSALDRLKDKLLKDFEEPKLKENDSEEGTDYETPVEKAERLVADRQGDIIEGCWGHDMRVINNSSERGERARNLLRLLLRAYGEFEGVSSPGFRDLEVAFCTELGDLQRKGIRTQRYENCYMRIVEGGFGMRFGRLNLDKCFTEEYLEVINEELLEGAFAD